MILRIPTVSQSSGGLIQSVVALGPVLPAAGTRPQILTGLQPGVSSSLSLPPRDHPERTTRRVSSHQVSDLPNVPRESINSFNTQKKFSDTKTGAPGNVLNMKVRF